MKQVAFFHHCSADELSETVNKFCAGHNVIDIKFSTETDSMNLYYCVCVIYEVEKTKTSELSWYIEDENNKDEK